MEKVIVAYIPVLHEGYHRLFIENSEAKTLYILSDKVAAEYTPIHKEIRALSNDLIISAIQSWELFETVEVATGETLVRLNDSKAAVVIPDELVTNEVAKKYLPDCSITRSSIFLRWDKKSATQENPVSTDAIITNDQADKQFIQAATTEGNKSSDWWRQVGAIAVRDGKVVAQAHNTHLPSEQQPYAESDPRAHFHKGDHIELTTAIHAEAKLIAESAATGISLKDADLFVTDFPCPVCAKLIAHAGFKRVYFKKGYAVLDGERVLKTKKVEIIQVTA